MKTSRSTKSQVVGIIKMTKVGPSFYREHLLATMGSMNWTAPSFIRLSLFHKMFDEEYMSRYTPPLVD